MATNDQRELRAAVIKAGYALLVNQAGPLLEHMARDHGDIRILTMQDGRYEVQWSGKYGNGSTILEAAMRCFVAYANRPCDTCGGDPAVCSTVPGLRHCEEANRNTTSTESVIK